MSLYPYICKYFKFPIGHPIIHVGDTCADIEACLKMKGLMKCKIVPPTNLSPRPTLQIRQGTYSACVERVQEHNAASECQHRSDAERFVEGTWVIDEVRLAVDTRYKILEILEVYEYQVTCYDPATGTGGHFADYIDTFLKLKQEASGCPSWARTENDKTRYMDQIHRDEGIRLDRDSIGYNAAKRVLAKLCLNSMWGKLTERSNRTQS